MLACKSSRNSPCDLQKRSCYAGLREQNISRLYDHLKEISLNDVDKTTQLQSIFSKRIEN